MEDGHTGASSRGWRPLRVDARRLLLLLASTGWLACQRGDLGASDDGSIQLALASRFSGAQAPSFAEVSLAIELAVADINTEGGVLGRPLALLKADSGEAASGLDATTQLLDRGARIVLNADGGPADTQTVAAATTSRGALLYEVGMSAAVDLAPHPLVFRDTVSATLLSAATVAYVDQHPIEHLIFICPDRVAYLCEQTKQGFHDHGIPADVVWTTLAPWLAPEAFDFTPAVREMLTFAQDQPWTYWASTHPLVHIKALLRLTDLTTPEQYPEIIVDDEILGARDFLSLLPRPLLDKVSGFVRSPIRGTALADAFRERFRAVYGLTPASLAARGYTAVYLLALAIEAAGSTEPAKIAARMREVSHAGTSVTPTQFALARSLLAQGEDIDFDGPTGPADFDPDGNLGAILIADWRVDVSGTDPAWVPATSTVLVCQDVEGTGDASCMPYVPPR
jgi:branched-chain amino acid transport system substrate-binding protein